MKYQEGRVGRIFYLSFDHGDELMTTLQDFVKEKDIRCGMVQLLGALQNVSCVVGPEEDVVPPVPSWCKSKEVKEIIGIASILWDADQPRIHLHAGLGRADKSIIGCVRKDATVYLVIEAMIMEINDIHAKRVFDEKLEVQIPRFM